jgi:hypothetical protein
MSYKRNQIEEAIARIFDPNCKQPPSELRTRIKRLLELDRPICGSNGWLFHQPCSSIKSSSPQRIGRPSRQPIERAAAGIDLISILARGEALHLVE